MRRDLLSLPDMPEFILYKHIENDTSNMELISYCRNLYIVIIIELIGSS